MSKHVYPSHADYNLQIRYIDRFLSDPILRAGVVRSRSGVAVRDGGEALSYPGGFAKVYIVDKGAQTFALRVWLHEVSDAAERYRLAKDFLTPLNLPYFVDFEFISRGITVNGRKYPILRMEWVHGYALRDFIKLHRNQRDVMKSAAEQFRQMAAQLHKSKISHGDLQADNMLLQVQNGVVSYRLIDYDTLTVPKLVGRPLTSVGLSSYQHPRRSASMVTTERDDFFSELVIYLSLVAVTDDPTLWDSFPCGGRDKELLFEAADYVASSPSPLFRQLYQMGGLVRNLTCILWNFTRCPKIDLLVPVEDAVKLSTAMPQPSGAIAKKSGATEFDRMFASKLAIAQSTRRDSWLDDTDFRPPTAWTKVVAPPVGTSPVAAANKTFTEVLAQLNQTRNKSPVSPPVLTSNKAPKRVLVGVVVVIGGVILLNWLVKHDTEQSTVLPTTSPSPIATVEPRPVEAPEPTVAATFAPTPQATSDMRSSATVDADWQALTQQLRERAAREASQATPRQEATVTATFPPAPTYETPVPITYRVVNVNSNDYLNVRSGPGTDYPILLQLPATMKGILLEARRFSNGDTIWQEIRVGEYQGYVNEVYLEREY